MESLLSNPSNWLSMLIAASVKGSLILIVTLGFITSSKKAPAAFRHLLWVVALFSLFIFLFTGPLGVIKISSMMFPLKSNLVPQPNPVINLATGLVPVHSETGEATTNPITQFTITHTALYVMNLIWFLGAFFSSVRMMIGFLMVRKLRRASMILSVPKATSLLEQCKNQLGIESRVDLLLGPAHCVPATSGLLRPFILLPPESLAWPSERFSAVLWHELAHIRRRDILTYSLAKLIATFHWFNPLVWYALKQCKTAQEEACDDMVLHRMRSSDYAHHLLEIVRGCRFTTALEITMGNQSTNERRIRNILNKNRNTSLFTQSMIWGATPLLLAIVTLTLIGPKHWAEASSPEKNSPVEITSKQNVSILWPLKGEISSPFGIRKHPTTGEERPHIGIDIRTPMHTPVASVSDGVLIKTGFQNDYGYYVAVDHQNGLTTWYAKLSQIDVKLGQKVKMGEIIALSGNSGFSTGPHLHFEVRKNGQPVNPLDYLK